MYGPEYPEQLLDLQNTLERRQSGYEDLRQLARRTLIRDCIWKRVKSLDEMNAEFSRLRDRYPADYKLADLMEAALKAASAGSVPGTRNTRGASK